MSSQGKRWTVWIGATGLAMVLACGVGMWLGARALREGPRPTYSERLLQASAAASTDGLSMATGKIDDDMEGVFLLNHTNGELICYVINYRQPNRMSGEFRANLGGLLGTNATRRPRYVMVTGRANFRRVGGAINLADCVVYVADASTGKFAALGLSWNDSAARSGAPKQAGSLVPLMRGG